MGGEAVSLVEMSFDEGFYHGVTWAEKVAPQPAKVIRGGMVGFEVAVGQLDVGTTAAAAFAA